jgi:hypothetical protein
VFCPFEKKRGQLTIEQKKKKLKIIQEGKKQLAPSDVGEEERKALWQTVDDATSGW